MQYRRHKGRTISSVGFGCYAASGVYGAVDLALYKEVIARAVALGITFFDVADAYGEAERILGEALEPYRWQVQIASKVGPHGGARANLRRETVRKACERSLRALRTERIDLYQIHFDDPDTAVGETIAALEELKREGKIGDYGVSHLPPHRVQEYIALGDPFSILMELSAVASGARHSLLPLCREHDVGAIAFSVTGRGLLTGCIDNETVFEQDDIRRIDPLFQRERRCSGMQLARQLAHLGEEQGITPVQLGIAWVLHQPGVICALTGPTSIAHLEENVVAGQLELPEPVFQKVEALVEKTNRRLRQQQAASVSRILTTALPQDPQLAFVDLLYAMETSVELGFACEAEILPAIQELFALRERSGESGRELHSLQNRLEEMLEVVFGGRSGKR